MHKNTTFFIYISLFFVVISAFSFSNLAQAADEHLIISEILIGGASADEEFIELYNPTTTDVDLKILPLKLHIVSSTGTDTSKTLSWTTSSPTIKSHEYFVIASAVFKENHSDVAISATYSAGLVSNGAVYISTSATKNINMIDSTCWGASTKCDFPLPDPKSGFSLERIANGADWQESCETGGTSGKEFKECPVEQPPQIAEANTDQATKNSSSENFSSSGKVYLSEIFPNPKEGEEEYIEIANGSNVSVDLTGWKIKDASKSKGYELKGKTILPGDGYLVLYRSETKISLNNSTESIYLYNPTNELISYVTYEKSAKGASYNFNGQEWKWSKYPTPGEKNKFDSPPKVKIKKPKNVYKDMAANFSAIAKDKETNQLKYAWDFGDGKKSSRKKTTHKYIKTGKYSVTLSVSDESQTVEKKFTVDVKNSSRPDLEIVKIVPNPAGADSETEAVDIKNNSNKKVDLAGWKIATGSGGKIFNHPISGKFSINPSETKIITREFSKFSLNNKAGKVALVMPDGKVIDKISYGKEKIAEGEAYEKTDGQWRWLVPDNGEGGTNREQDDEFDGEEAEVIEDPMGEIEAKEISDTEDIEEMSGEVLGASDGDQDSIENNYSSFSSENAFVFLSRVGFSLPQNEPNYCPMKNSFFSLAYLLASSI